MSEASIDFQPAMEEPSNIKPSSRKSSSTCSAITVTCCSLPRGSVKRMSTYSISSSLICLRIASLLILFFLFLLGNGLERVRAVLAGADADRLFYGADENLAVANLVGFCGVDDRLYGGIDLIVVEHDVDLHLGQEVHHIFGPAIEFGMALLTAEPLDLDNRKALNASFLQRFLHLVELEGLDDRFDLFHRRGPPRLSFRNGHVPAGVDRDRPNNCAHRLILGRK